MGNYCCSEKHQSSNSKPRVSTVRLKSLNDPSTKKEYEKSLQQILNQALIKFQEKQKITQLKLKGLLGKGGQASVFQVDVVSQKNGEMNVRKFAMKRVTKKYISQQNVKKALLLQKQILAVNPSAFVTEIEFACQDDSYIYFFMSLAIGGDCYSLIKQQQEVIFASNPQNTLFKQKIKRFQQIGEKAVIFILASVILGLQSLQLQNVVYRDLKPENILIFEDGYPKLADFGVAAKHDDQNQYFYEMKGTVLYFAPEIVKRKGYDKAIDLWALGVLAYQLTYKSPPFSSCYIKSLLYEKKISERLRFNTWPIGHVSRQMKHFINKLLILNPKQRLGYQSFEQIKKHKLFKGINWEHLQNKQMQSPLLPIVKQFPVSIKSEVQMSETIQLQNFGHIPFTFVRNNDQGKAMLQINPLTMYIGENTNLKMSNIQDTKDRSSIQSCKVMGL